MPGLPLNPMATACFWSDGGQSAIQMLRAYPPGSISLLLSMDECPNMHRRCMVLRNWIRLLPALEVTHLQRLAGHSRRVKRRLGHLTSKLSAEALHARGGSRLSMSGLHHWTRRVPGQYRKQTKDVGDVPYARPSGGDSPAACDGCPGSAAWRSCAPARYTGLPWAMLPVSACRRPGT